MKEFMYYFIIILIIGSTVFEYWLLYLNRLYIKKPIPAIVKDVYDDVTYKKWIQYNSENQKIAVISMSLNMLILLVFIIFNLFTKLQTLSENISNNAYIQVLLFIGIYYFVTFIKGIFIQYYRTFYIEEKYGFNKQTKGVFVSDLVKQLILTIILGGGLIQLIHALFIQAGNQFYIYTFLSLVIIMTLVNVLYTKLFVPLFNKITPLEEGSLKQKIYEFANRVGYNVSKINVIDASRRSSRLNAYFSGFGKFRQIMLYDTLIEKMEEDEIVAVLAHEIGHYKHKDTLFGLATSILMMAIYLALFLFILKTPLLHEAFGFNGVNFAFGMILFIILIEPIEKVFSLPIMWFSRKHEYQADQFAAQHDLRKPLQNALIKLNQENLSNLNPHPLIVKLKYSHPPLRDRLQAIAK